MSAALATDRTAPPTGVSQFAPPPYSHTWASERGFTVVRWILGLLLITTAVMKLTGGSGEILRVALPFASPRVYSSGVVFELILGLWLISGLARAWSWLISMLFCGLLGYMSFRLGMYGQASCGCFGKIAVNPWWAFAIDVAAVVALLASRPRITSFEFPKTIGSIIGVSIALLAAFVFFADRTGSPFAALYLRDGQTNAIIPGVAIMGEERSDMGHSKNSIRNAVLSISNCDFGKIPRGWICSEVIDIGNSSDEEFTIVGWKAACDCVTIDGALPILVANGVTELIAELDLSNNLTFEGKLAIDLTFRIAGLQSGRLRDIVTLVVAEVASP